MGTPEEHQAERVGALEGEVAALREAVLGIPAAIGTAVKTAIEEAFPATEGEGHKHEPASE